MTGTTTTAIDWRVTEQGRGRPLVLVHGFTGAGASWAEHVDALADDSRVITPDLPGHGATPAAAADAMTVEATADADEATTDPTAEILADIWGAGEPDAQSVEAVA